MNTTEIILALLSSTVIAALISAFVSKLNQDKSNKLKYVTEERQRWRTELRAAAVELRRIGNTIKETNDGKVKEENEETENENDIRFRTVAEARTYFQVRLNPNDDEDNELLKLIVEEGGRIPAENLDKLSEAISWLLKHDWERVKQEASTTRLTSIYYYIIVASGIYMLLLINGKVFFPEMYKTVINSLNIDTELVRSISVLCLPVLLIVPLLLLIFARKWRKCKERLTNSDGGCDEYLRETLEIPFRKSIKKQEKKNGKND